MSTTTVDKLTAQEIIELSRKHTISEWAAQGAVDPLPIERAEGIYLYAADGKFVGRTGSGSFLKRSTRA